MDYNMEKEWFVEMKKWFNRQDEDAEYTEEMYEEDYEESDDVVYEDEVEDGEYEDEAYEEEVDGEVYEDEAYEEEVDGEVYEDEAYEEEVDGEVYEDEVYEDEVYEDEEYEDVEYDEEAYEDGYDEEESASRKGLFIWFAQMSGMDKVMITTGILVVLMALITGAVFLRWNSGEGQKKELATVGAQLDGIDIIGDKGLLAVADAQKAKEQVADVVEEEKPGYQEVDYTKNVTVLLKMVSVQKDLKIKFVNKSSEKLIPNVPFVVTITTPEGKTETWSDDDMDGIIYKKNITPGNYKVAVNELSGDKFAGYALPKDAEKVEVKKDIAYKKIDVSDEVKNESEIDVSKEEQKKQEPAVESSLNDTVDWVASTAVTSTYVEVSKSSITDPMTLAFSGKILRMAGEVRLDQTALELKAGKSQKLSPSYSLEDVIATGWNSNDSSIATVDADGNVTAVGAGTTTITYVVTVNKETTNGYEEINYKASCEVTVVKENTNNLSVSVNPDSLSLNEGATGSVQISTSGFTSGKSLVYHADSNDTDIADAEVDKNGKVTITAVSAGKTTIAISANYVEEPIGESPTTYLTVTVAEKGSFTLDKTAVTVYMDTPVTINAVVNGDIELTAKSSDSKVATVSVSGKAITITGVKAGSAKVTVTAKGSSNGNIEVCAVTVKQTAKSDTKTLLKDNNGNQLYVQENGSYREAVYADYYKDVKLFKKGETKYTGWQTIDGRVYFYDKNGKKVTGEQVIQGAKYNFGSDGALVTSGSGVMGIDVSKHNATIDWNAVKNSGVNFVIIRCGYRGYTQGSLVIDPKFKENLRGATNAGLKVGVYFFSQAVDEVEAVQEASFVLEEVKGYKISYPIFLDVEYSGAAGNKGRADGLSKSARTAVCKAFCATIQSGGYTAGVYANKNWLEEKIDPGQLGSYKIWLAQYAATPSYKGRYDMWQYKATGKVSGITGNVDMDISYMNY